MLNPTFGHLLSGVVIIYLSSALNAAQAQQLPKEVLFERISIPGTIRSSQVTNIIQDDLGMIWLAGHGLYRYDGYRFRQYSELLHNGNKEVINSQDIISLFYDRIAKRVLVGTRRFGVAVYDLKRDQLVALPSATPAPIVNHLAQTRDGKIWVSSFTNGLYYLDQDTMRKFSPIQKILLRPLSLLTQDSSLVVGDIGRVLILNQGKVSEEIPLSWQGRTLATFTHVTALALDRNGMLWIGTEKQGVLVYDRKQKKSVKYFAPTEAPFFSKISRILQDRDGLIWILTKASGVVVYSPEQDRILRLTRDPFSTKSLSSDNCFSIAEDRHGTIWIGATGDINKYDRQQVKFKHIYHTLHDKLSLTDNMVRGVFEDKMGKVWIGTDGGFINLLDLKKETVEPIKIKIPGDSTNYVPLYFLQLSDRIMLIGTPLGLLQYDRDGKVFSPYKPLWKQTQRKIVRQMIRDGNTLYFIGGGSLFIHDLITGKTESTSTAGDKDALNMTAIFLDEKRNLWIGSSKGLSYYEPANKRFHFIRFKNIPNAADGFLLLVLSIEKIGSKLYVGTFNAGLWEFDVSDMHAIPPPIHYTDSDGLPSNTIYSTVPGSDGSIWLSTNSGLVKFDPGTKYFLSFSISEGLQEEEFNRLAYAKTRSGNLIFGGINGINIFHPRDITVEKEKFVPLLLSVSAHNPVAKDPVVSRFTEFGDGLMLNYDQNFINIHFFVPHYKQPKRYALFYKLDQFEKDWKEVTIENSATYANLQSGAYNFQLKTVGLNGQESHLQLPIVIAAPYWKKWWFILLAFLVVAFLVMTIIRSYIRKAQYDRQRLEELLRVRTHEIENSREDLRVLNQKKDLIFSILSHDLRSPLTTLKGFLGYIIDHAHELSTADLKKHAISIKNSVTNSLDLIDNTLYWSLSQMGNIQYTPTCFSLHHLLEKLRGLYQLTADKKRIPLSISCEDEIMLHGDENMIYVTLRNLVSNALKFTSEGNPVSITCKPIDQFVEISVSDKGIGMSQEYVKKILSMGQPMLKKGTSNEKGTGLGLLLCKNFIELNKGKLNIVSTENVGTTFIVTLPLAVASPATATPSSGNPVQALEK
jgi:signal transduction histidine kinase/ligand-binding sensor domain-containing protein